MPYANPSLPWIVVPVKPFHETKTRLAPVLDTVQRADLTRRLLAQQLATLAPFRLLAHLVVISRGTDVLHQAAEAGFDVLVEARPHELNGAANQARLAAAAARAPALILLPVDLPWMSGSDVDALLAAPADQISIATDRHQRGTNGLRLPPELFFRFQYGSDSLFYHREEARRWGAPCQVLTRPGLQFDLDTVDDWEIYERWRLAAANNRNGNTPSTVLRNPR
jgi:2-phospho-L-lactate guanylyltransferase